MSYNIYHVRVLEVEYNNRVYTVESSGWSLRSIIEKHYFIEADNKDEAFKIFMDYLSENSFKSGYTVEYNNRVYTIESSGWSLRSIIEKHINGRKKINVRKKINLTIKRIALLKRKEDNER